MSYKQAINWYKKHPKGIPNLYLGFDSSSDKSLPTVKEAADFYPEYVAFHQKRGTLNILSLAEYIKARTN